MNSSLQYQTKQINLKLLQAGNQPKDKEAKEIDRLEQFKRSTMTSEQMLNRELPPREALLGDWLQVGDYGIIFAKRGAGKSWLALMMANAIANGKGLGSWKGSNQARKVLYLDAEMNLPDLQQRVKKIGNVTENLILLTNEELLREGDPPIDIAKERDQKALLGLLEDGMVFVIDNLSTAAYGLSENDNDDWERISKWLLELRHKQVTCILVHHAGKNGEIRGASRREDMSHWVIQLTDSDAEKEADCLTFETKHTKCRNAFLDESNSSLLWKVDLRCDPALVKHSTDLETEKVLQLIESGMTSATEIAKELNISPSSVSKRATKLFNAGRIEKSGRGYSPKKNAESAA